LAILIYYFLILASILCQFLFIQSVYSCKFSSSPTHFFYLRLSEHRSSLLVSAATTITTAMSDDEFDKDWKPTGRPQSTMARSFSLALNDLFKIDNSIADLDAAVFEKKRAVSSQTSELEALEARLRETEERLKAKQAVASDPTRRHSGMGSPRTRQALGDTFNRRQDGEGENRSPSSPLAATHENTKTPSRPPTGGAMPPTPGASEDYDRPAGNPPSPVLDSS
ncbi:hypothetical protein DH86_00003702, partial [Scytalidium sp. 3C]